MAMSPREVAHLLGWDHRFTFDSDQDGSLSARILEIVRTAERQARAEALRECLEKIEEPHWKQIVSNELKRRADIIRGLLPAKEVKDA